MQRSNLLCENKQFSAEITADRHIDFNLFLDGVWRSGHFPWQLLSDKDEPILQFLGMTIQSRFVNNYTMNR